MNSLKDTVRSDISRRHRASTVRPSLPHLQSVSSIPNYRYRVRQESASIFLAVSSENTDDRTPQSFDKPVENKK